MNVAVISGATGFIGTNLTLKLLSQGYVVIGNDNFSSSEKSKLALLEKNSTFSFIEGDICRNKVIQAIEEELDAIDHIDRLEIYNLACPASPPRYQALPLETMEVCTTGVINLLKLAKKYDAPILHTSTSEVYGDPLEHPQRETYRGNVNTVGPRSCYDEGKRMSETICYEHQKLGVDVKVCRIFNTYGPYMDLDDGRVVTNFITQALKGEDITVHGDGSQTRSFQYIDDLLAGFEAFMNSNEFGPINLGNPDEFTILELAEAVIALTNSKSEIIHKPLPKDDPTKRKPDISRAKQLLGWKPEINLNSGLQKTVEYVEEEIQRKQ